MKLFLTGLKDGMEIFGGSIAVLVNTLLLSAIYLIGVGLTAVAARFAGKKFLVLRPDPDLASYWSDLGLSHEPREHYYRQF